MGNKGSRLPQPYLISAGSYNHVDVRNTHDLLPEARIPTVSARNWSLLPLDDAHVAVGQASDPYSLTILDLTTLAFPSSGSPASRQPTSATKQSQFDGHRACVNQLCAISKPSQVVQGDLDGIFASCSNDQTVKLWSYAGEELGTYTDQAPLTCLAYDGNAQDTLQTTLSPTPRGSRGVLFYGGDFFSGIPSALLADIGSRNWTRRLQFDDPKKFQRGDGTFIYFDDELDSEEEEEGESDPYDGESEGESDPYDDDDDEEEGEDWDSDEEYEEDEEDEEEIVIEAEASPSTPKNHPRVRALSSVTPGSFPTTPRRRARKRLAMSVRVGAMRAVVSSNLTPRSKGARSGVPCLPRLRSNEYYCGIREFSIERLKVSGRYVGHVHNVEALCMTPGDADTGPMLCSGSADSTVKLWDCQRGLTDGPVLTLLQESEVDDCATRTTALHCVRDLVLCGMARGEIAVWDVRNPKQALKLFRPHLQGGNTYGILQVEEGVDSFISVNQAGSSGLAKWDSTGKVEASCGDIQGHFSLIKTSIVERSVWENRDEDIKERKKQEAREEKIRRKILKKMERARKRQGGGGGKGVSVPESDPAEGLGLNELDGSLRGSEGLDGSRMMRRRSSVTLSRGGSRRAMSQSPSFRVDEFVGGGGSGEGE